MHYGGPVETARGFVLHSADYHAEDATMAVEDGVSMTATLDILHAIAMGVGPDRAIVALGYAGWAPGQLDDEIQANGWLNAPPDLPLIFDNDNSNKWNRAVRKVGIDPSFLSSDAGHA